MKRVLIIGGSGFIGTTCQEAWRRKYQLIAIDRDPPRERFPEVKYGIADILNRSDLQRTILELEPDHIVHLAARARVQDGVTDPIGTFRTNVEGTINVLEAAARVPELGKCVVASSETVYGVVETYPTPEELGPGKPTSAYAASKAAADLLAQRLGERFVVARSAMGCGPRSSPVEQVTSRFILNVLQGKPLKFPGLPPSAVVTGGLVAWDDDGVQARGRPDAAVAHPTRDISPAWNFAHGVSLILDNPDASGVYNLGSGTELTILELARRAIRVLGRGELGYDASFAYRSGEAGYRTALDISRARKDLGYEPQVSLERAIKLTATWMEAHPDYWQRKRVPWHEAWTAWTEVAA